MTEIDEILTKLESDDRYSQSKCLKCEKGFENHEYHCFGPDLDGCMASQKELQITVNQWKKERNKASSIIHQLQSDLAASRKANSSEFKRGQEVMREVAAKDVNNMGFTEEISHGLVRGTQNYYRARDAISNLPIG